MKAPLRFARYTAKKIKSILESAYLSYPKAVQCNVCRWEGRRFLSDSWHKHINCPRCGSGLRQRLFFAALQNIEQLSFDRVIRRRRILHFAPEDIVSLKIRDEATSYTTADFLRNDCDFRLDMSNMPEIKGDSFDIVIAFDVLEHVPNYQKALGEVQRILSSRGFGIFTVPQKDNLLTTYEDPTILTPQDRIEHFGQWDHLRIFGEDFPKAVESEGFTVFAVNESMFSEDVNRLHVLFPPMLSKHPLATNFRKVFFCQKTS
jgi:SAM-dependent methyltransferase